MSLRTRLTPPSTRDEVFARRWQILAVLCLSLVLIVAGNSSLNVALPTIVRELGATQTQLQWIVDAYAIVFAAMLLPAGALGDRYGRKGALQAGLTVFGLAAFAASFAADPVQVIAARAVMGLGAAFVMPATLSLLATSFPPRERGRAIAIWAGFAGAGGVIGPLLSGLLLERFWWGAVFFINLPIVAIALLAGAGIVPTSRDEQHRPLDPVGGLLSVTGLALALFAVIEGPARGWLALPTIAAFLAGVGVLGAFGWWEHRSANPMLDLSWFGDRNFSVGAGTITLAFFSAFGVFFLVTQYFQFVLGYAPITAAVAQLPVAASLITVAPRSAGLAERFGPNRVVAGGLALVATGLALLALTATVDATYLAVLPSLVLFGCGIALTTAPSTALILSAMPTDRAGVGSAVNDTTRELGGSLGVAVLGSILASLYRAGLPVAELPARVREIAVQSVGAALQVAEQAPQPELGRQLADAARAAFVTGFRVAFVVAAAVAVAAAAMVAAFGPDHVPGAGGDDASDARRGPGAVPDRGRAAAATGARPAR
jgi:EmrB/QacA subfamily drug resistance transporter